MVIRTTTRCTSNLLQHDCDNAEQHKACYNVYMMHYVTVLLPRLEGQNATNSTTIEEPPI